MMPVAVSSSFQNNALNQSRRVSPPQFLSPLMLPLKRYKTTVWDVKQLSAVTSDVWLKLKSNQETKILTCEFSTFMVLVVTL